MKIFVRNKFTCTYTVKLPKFMLFQVLTFAEGTAPSSNLLDEDDI